MKTIVSISLSNHLFKVLEDYSKFFNQSKSYLVACSAKFFLDANRFNNKGLVKNRYGYKIVSINIENALIEEVDGYIKKHKLKRSDFFVLSLNFFSEYLERLKKYFESICLGKSSNGSVLLQVDRFILSTLNQNKIHYEVFFKNKKASILLIDSPSLQRVFNYIFEKFQKCEYILQQEIFKEVNHG